MRPTRRAVALVVVCAVAVWLAATFGARSLNAVVVPVLVALVGSVVQLRLADRPAVHRNHPEPGFPGEARSVEIDIETDDPLTARITDRIGDGLRTEFSAATRSLPTTIEYDIELEDRGEHRLGPLTLTLTDVFGLLTREFRYPKRTPVLVYPTTYPLAADALAGSEEVVDERETFDELREYVRGDSLRDVHWKSSAKRNDLVVMEFDSRAESAALTIAAEATTGHADEMASAAASIATHLLDSGVALALALPGGRVEQAGGEQQRERVLRALARAGPGRVEASETDVHVFADAGGTQVTVADREMPFDRLAGRHSTVAATDGVTS